MKKTSFRILLTEACNAKCPNCFNQNVRTKKYMSLQEFEHLCQYLSSNGIQVLKIMGGEPSCHPQFLECITTSFHYFPSIALFTNGLEIDKIRSIQFRRDDTIIFNFNFFSERLLNTISDWTIPHIGFEVQISSGTNGELVRNQILRILELFGENRFLFKFTLDCTENIFAYKRQIIQNWKIITDGLGTMPLFSIDHAIPFCFVKDEGLVLPDNCHICQEGCFGLIDSSFMLRHCNQYNVPLINIINGNDFIPFHVIKNHLKMARHQKLGIALNKICVYCPYFDTICNGGCFMHKPLITRESILQKN